MAVLESQVPVVLAVGVISSLLFRAFIAIVTPKPPILVTDVNKCHELLSSTTLEKRAGPNQRLVVAFGIENGFTTTKEEVHRKFREEVKTSLERNNNDLARKRLGVLISDSIQDFLQKRTGTHQSIPLASVVQIAVFRAALAIFFPDVPRISEDDIIFISSKMTSIWHDSKSRWKTFLAKYFKSRSSIIQDKNKLHEKLKEVFPSLKGANLVEPRENPLNILLPAFMGLYRSVLHCLVEVRFRSSPANLREYVHLFRQFLDDPNGRWYAEENNLSVQHIIAETLRLYPPTRRIYTEGADGVGAVDIEQIHRMGKVWGKQPLRFDPKRWEREGLDVVRTVEYLPFGGKVGTPAEISTCPSRIRGGPKLIAIIVGSLLSVLGEEWGLVTFESLEQDAGLVLKPLPSCVYSKV
jgi:hypothetical protein